MTKIKAFPFHTFFLGIYFVLYIYVQNIMKVTLSMTYRSLAVCSILSLFFFGASYLVFKNRYKAGTFTTLLLMGLLTYGAFYNEFEKVYYNGWFPFSNIHRYAFALYCIIYVWLFIAIFKSKSTFVVSSKVLNLFLLIVIAINFAGIVRFSVLHPTVDSSIANPFITHPELNQMGVCNEAHEGSTPDIYYIILDGYGSRNTLSKYYNFKNDKFFDFLNSKAFVVADSSKTVYPYTDLSLASSLNMNYIDSVSALPAALDQKLIAQNFLTYYLKKKKYRIVNVESGYAVTKRFDFADETIQLEGINEFERSMMQLSVLRLDDILGISTYFSLKSVLKRMHLATKSASPKFVFIHIVAPHPPYVFNADGSFKLRKPAGHFSWEPRKDYIDQLIYVNKVVVKFISMITSDPKKQPVIVLQSDHGPWIKDSSESNVYEARRGILNAYLVPKDWRSSFANNTSPVNSFRLVLNHLFHSNFNCLPVTVPNRKYFLRLYAHKINNL